MKNNKKEKGFTLVELSIVLVIIGLLIGGILVAQSLIDSTKIQSFTRQIGQFDAAVGTFVDKFGDLPGDNTLFDATETTVDGNVEDDNGAVLLSTGEISTFWLELSQTGLKNGDGADYVDMGTDGISAGTDAPASAIGLSNTAVVAFGVSGENFYHVAGYAAADTTIATGDAIAPADALSVDVKIDDGNPAAGNVIASIGAVMGAPDDGTPGSTECYLTTTTYNAGYDENVCQLQVRIGTGTGNLQ